MFVEELNEIEFESYRGRDAFIAEVMEAIDIHITDDEIEEISKLLGINWFKIVFYKDLDFLIFKMVGFGEWKD